MLFELQYEENNDPIEDVNITTTILYYSEEELKEFKALAKVGIRAEFKQDFSQKGNLSDFLLLILRRHYGNKNI
jgi:hypothetical protein